MPAKAALGFSSFEYFWLTVLGLSCAALISLGGLLKGALALLLGLFIAQVSMDPLTATPRSTECSPCPRSCAQDAARWRKCRR